MQVTSKSVYNQSTTSLQIMLSTLKISRLRIRYVNLGASEDFQKEGTDI